MCVPVALMIERPWFLGSKRTGMALLLCVVGCAGDPCPSGAVPAQDPPAQTAPPAVAPSSGGQSDDAPRAAEPTIWYAMQFVQGRGAGSPAAYFGLDAAMPKPALHMVYGNVALWRADRALQAQRLRLKVREASRFGIKGLLYTPNGGCDAVKRRTAGGGPAMDVMARRPWSTREPGFLAELEAQRDVIAQLVNEGMVDFLVLRPWQEAGAGGSLGCGFTPASYRTTIEWLVADVYRELPVRAVIVHWNRMASIADTLPQLDDGIEVYAGVSMFMPSWGKDGNLYRARERKDFASVAWQTAGVKTWIAELAPMGDRRRDARTGWAATGLRETSVIHEFLEHYRTMRSSGHVAGLTWLNLVGFDGTADNRWDAPTVDPAVRAWWIGEVTEANGYILGPTGAEARGPRGRSEARPAPREGAPGS